MKQNNWKVYILKCSDATFYCGVTNKPINERVEVHNNGKGAKYTRARLPVELLAVSNEMSKSEAYKLEYKIKKLPRNRKIEYLNQFN
ncbi:MAG: GIY-YIG nuclease family protein [Cyanobacteriota bacterium]